MDSGLPKIVINMTNLLYLSSDSIQPATSITRVQNKCRAKTDLTTPSGSTVRENIVPMLSIEIRLPFVQLYFHS